MGCGPRDRPRRRDRIEEVLIRLVDDEACSIIVTTGGTGPAPRDVTPEATEAVCDRILPGFGEQMRAISLRFVPTAILSRQLGGHRGSCLIINLPGQPKAIRETIDEIWRAVPYAVDLLGGPYLDVDLRSVMRSDRSMHGDMGGTKTPDRSGIMDDASRLIITDDDPDAHGAGSWRCGRGGWSDP